MMGRGALDDDSDDDSSTSHIDIEGPRLSGSDTPQRERLTSFHWENQVGACYIAKV